MAAALFQLDCQNHSHGAHSMFCFLTLVPAAPGSETPSRTSWSHFFVKDAAKHNLVVAAESLIAALFASPTVIGPHKPLHKVEALQGESALRQYTCSSGRGRCRHDKSSPPPAVPDGPRLILLILVHLIT